ncbi:hypothetical protein [Paraburkholderia phytofirmans]|uniref:hypothetical protein n=1 Tax=Paraburkholderia phytofirmans TaxID=261302 RepID=UPI0011DFCBFD|nr:hypothetical protein [Paraburkholderia phytofirmans]
MKINSFIFSGDFALRELCLREEATPSGVTCRFDRDAYASAVCEWSNNPNFAWRTLTEESIGTVKKRNIFVILFDSLDIVQARCVDNALWKLPYYIGAMDVGYRSSMNVALYEVYLIRIYRLNGRGIDVLVDECAGDDPGYESIKKIRRCGLQPVRIKKFHSELDCVEFVP